MLDKLTIGISKILLSNFRNFSNLEFSFQRKQFIAFVGANGSGKTNLLEALTLFNKSGTLRGKQPDEMIKEASDNFSVHVELHVHEYIDNLTFKYQSKKKYLSINNQIATEKIKKDFEEHFINFVYLIPQIEGLFYGNKSDRRDYLDKIVADFNSQHMDLVRDYKKLLKERLNILQKFFTKKSDINIKEYNSWVTIVEKKIVETGIAIAYNRIEAIEYFNKAIENLQSYFPKASLIAIGQIEEMIYLGNNSQQVESYFLNQLEITREKDFFSQKTNFGVHKSDFDALFLNKNQLATKSSTGEQKLIMIAISFARAKISSLYKKRPTILIFDEILSHLDENNRKLLFEEIRMTDIQTFITANTAENIGDEFFKVNIEK